MATITLKYDTQNDLAQSIINSMKSAGVFTVVEENVTAYDKEFVKKIQESEQQFAEGKYKTIKTCDLWK